MDGKTLDQMIRAKKLSVPFISLTTPDPVRAANEISTALKDLSVPFGGENRPLVVVHWDVVNGLYAIQNDESHNILGNEWVKSLEAGDDNPFQNQEGPGAGNPVAALEMLSDVPPNSIVFFHQSNRWLDGQNPDARASIQAAVNLRNSFKATFRTLVFLSPEITLPIELRSDTMSLDDPLPSTDQLRQFFKDHKTLGDVVPNEKDRDRAASFVTGLSSFGAEQSLYLSLKRDEKNELFMDMSELRELRYRTIEQTRGLHIHRGQFTFDDVAGVTYIKSFLNRLMTGKEPPNVIVNVEEIEKAMAGIAGDNTGISQDQLGSLLDHMEEFGDEGIIFFGPPGCSKSYIAQTLGATYGIDTIRFDLNGMKQSEVGASEANIRQALKVVHAASGGRKLWIATCNSVSNLNEALLRRFTYGITFFDLPDKDERKSIWGIQSKRFNLSKSQIKDIGKINDKNWSGAEIRTCCRLAYKMNMALLDAAKDISPVAIQKPHVIKEMREQAHQRYKCASSGSLFLCNELSAKNAAVGGRNVAV